MPVVCDGWLRIAGLVVFASSVGGCGPDPGAVPTPIGLPSAYPEYLAIRSGQTLRLSSGAPPSRLVVTPAGTVQIELARNDSGLIIIGLRRGFARWDSDGLGLRPTWIAVLDSIGDTPLLVAHRGVSAVAPENTLASIRAACERGFSGVELDIRFTRDSVPVLLHDRDVERTSDGVGYVDELSFADLRRLDFGSWFGFKFRGERIPSLREALSAAAACGFDAVHLDLKSFTPLTTDSGLVHVVRVATEAGVVDRVQLAADLHTLRRAKALVPGIATLVFGGIVTADFAAAVIQSGISAVGIRYADYGASSAPLAVLDSAGVTVGVWAPPGVLELNALEPAPHFVTAGWAWSFPR